MPLQSRRRFLQSGLALTVGGFTGCTSPYLGGSGCQEGRKQHNRDASLSSTAAWPMYRYDTGNTGYNPKASGPSTDAEIAWRYNACGSGESGVIIEGGRAHVGGLGLDGQTGQRLYGDWQSNMRTPAVSNGMLYVCSGSLEARNPQTGETEWTFGSGGRSVSYQALTIAEDTVYVSDNLLNTSLYAVSAGSGEEIWQFGVDGLISSPVAVVDETLYVIDETETLYAIDTDSGEEQWHKTFESSFSRAGPVVANETIYLGSWDGEVLALRTADGSEIWRQIIPVPDFRIGNPVAVADGMVYASGREGTILALDVVSGEIVWQKSKRVYELGPPSVADGVVYTGGNSIPGTLFALDATTGDEQWRLDTREDSSGDETEAGIPFAPAIVEDILYAVTVPGDIYAIRG